MSANKHYTSLTDLFNASKLPGDFEGIENSLNQGINIVLSNVLYTDYNVQVLKAGEARLYRIKILTKTLRLPLVSGLNLVFFKGSESLASEFDIEFQWHWPLAKYLRNFKHQGFSYMPEAFIDILIDLTELNSREEFFYNLVTVFLNDGDDKYLTFFDNLNTTIVSYDTGVTAVTAEIQNITSYITAIKNEIDNQVKATDFFTIASMFERYKNSDTIVAAIDSIQTSFEVLEEDHDITIDLNSIVTGVLLNLFSDTQEKFNRLLNLFQNWLADITTDDIKSFLIPQFSLQLNGISMSLEFPRSILKPLVESSPGVWEVDESEIGSPPEKVKASLDFTSGHIKFDTQAGFDIAIDENHQIYIPRCRIAGTNLDLEFKEVKLDLSRRKNIPEAKLDKRPEDFIGCYVTEGKIGFPANWNHDPNSTAEIVGKNLLIGTGGISGTIGMQAKQGVNSAPLLKLRLGQDFNISLDAFSIALQQNQIKDSTIAGTLNIPGLKKKVGNNYEPLDIAIEAFIGNNGDFKISAKPDQAISFYLEKIARVDVKSLALGKENDKYYIDVAGAIDFTELTKQIQGIETDFPSNIEVKKLRIWENGKMEFDKGILPLPKTISISIGKTVKMSVSSLLLSSTEQYRNGVKRQYNIIGFDGSLDVGPGGVNVKGQGVKIFYTTDNDANNNKPLHVFLRVEGIELEIKVPANKNKNEADFWLRGKLAVKSKDTENETVKTYQGEIDFAVNKAKITGSAKMNYTPKVPRWMIDASVEIPAGIPMGNTGLAIYGFRGLAGKNKRFDKKEEETWWKMYKRPTEGINPDKFKDEKGFAIGLGVNLASQTDEGRPFSSNLMLILGLPDVLMLQGQAAFMKERVKFGDIDPPFSILISIDKESIQAGLGVKYLKPMEGNDQDGSIINLYGEAQMAYFWKNAKAWYVNIGKDDPESERIKAKIIGLYDAYAYLMLSASGIKMGAGTKWEFNKGIGPVSIRAKAFMDMYGRINFKPTVLGGGFSIGGNAMVSLIKFKAGIDILAFLQAEVPRPYQVHGGLDVKLDLPKPLKGKKVHLEFSWIFNKNRLTDAIGILETGANEEKKPTKAINMLNGEPFDVNLVKQVDFDINTSVFSTIPMDSFIDIEFANSPKLNLNNNSIKIGGEVTGIENTIVAPPIKGLSEQVRHKFEINQITIEAYNGTTWVNYNIFEASDIIQQIPNLNTSQLPQAYWQLKEPNKNTQLRIMAQNMFSYLNQTITGSIETERLGYEGGVVFCEQNKIANTCINFESDAVDSVYPANKVKNKEGIAIRVLGKDGKVKTISNSYNLTKGLEFEYNDGIEIIFTEPQNVVKPKVSAATSKIIYFDYMKEKEVGTDHNDLPIFSYETIRVDKVVAANLNTYTGYEDDSTSVTKVKITQEDTTILNPLHNSDLRIGYSCIPSQWETNANSLFIIDELQIIGKGVDYNEVDEIYSNGYIGGNLIAEWKLNGNGNDSSGNSFNGTGVNNPVSVIGRNNPNTNKGYVVGKSGFYSGSIPKYFNVSHNNKLSIGKESFTISAWIKLNADTTQLHKQYWNHGRRTIVSKMSNTHGGFELSILGQRNHFNNQDMSSVSFRFKPDNSYSYIPDFIIQCDDFLDNEWHHVLVTKSSTNAYLNSAIGMDICIYVDCKLLYREPFFLPNQSNNNNLSAVHSICSLSKEKHIFNKSIPAQSVLNDQNNKMKDGLTKAVQPIWRPETKYRILIKGKDIVDGNSNDDQSYYVLFKTSGSTGHFTKPNVPQDDDNFLLGKISGYIDYKYSNPKPNGNILKAKPLFYKTPKIKLLFKSPYMNLMFDEWSSYNNLPVKNYNLLLQIKDSKNEQENALAVTPTWSEIEEKIENNDINMLNNLLRNGANCWGNNGELKRKLHKTEYNLPNLLPSNLYSATYFSKNILDENILPVEVHKYLFQTSKFGNFKEQIESYTNQFNQAIETTVAEENFITSNGGFSAGSGTNLGINNKLYVESAFHPTLEIELNLVKGILYTISFDYIYSSFNIGADPKVYCEIQGKKLFSSNSIQEKSTLFFSFYSETTGISKLNICLENNNIGKVEYLIVDNFICIVLPFANSTLVEENFDNGSLGSGSFIPLMGSNFINPSDLLRVQNINDPRFAYNLEVMDGLTYTVNFEILDISMNGGGPVDIKCDAGVLGSSILPLMGVPMPQNFSFVFTSNFTGNANLEFGFSMPANMATPEFIEIDNFEILVSNSSPINIITENFNNPNNNFVAPKPSKLEISKKLFCESTSGPALQKQVELEANKEYTVSFDILGKTNNSENENVRFFISNIIDETREVNLTRNHSFKFNCETSATKTIEISLPDEGNNSNEILAIANFKIVATHKEEIVRPNFYNLALNFSAGSITEAIDIVNNSNSQSVDLKNKFNIPFDRLLFGALKEIQQFNDASATEIVKIINSNNNQIIGLLIRNPEPLFNFELSEQNINDSLIVERHFNNQIDTNFKLIYSNDLSQVFVTNADLNMIAGDYQLKFKYYEHNGYEFSFNNQTENQATLNITI